MTRDGHHLCCCTRNNAFKKDSVNYETTSDITGQANHLGVTIQADIINKRLVKSGHRLGRKSFQCPFDDGVLLLNAVKDVYL